LATVTVEEVGPCKKQLKITVPVADVEAKMEETYSRLQSNAVVDGFRKGRVPRKLLEKRFGEDVLEEVKQAVLADSSEEALKERGLKPLGEPSFDNVDFAADKDCVFEVTLEVEPEFELPEYKGIHLKKEVAKVTDEEINGGLERLRMQRARLELMPDGADVAADDRIVCDWEIVSEGEQVASEKDDEIYVRGKRFGEVELNEDLVETLPGTKSGAEAKVEGKVLDSYPIEKWRGKECVVAITPKEVRRPVLPELDEEFAKQMDFESLADMRTFVQRSLQQSKEREADMALEQQLFDKLLEQCPFDLPEGVLKAQARNIMVRQQFRLRQRGVPEEEVQKHLDALRNASEEAAARNLKIYFILTRIADKEKIFVTENDVQNRIAAMANSYRIGTQRMRAQLEQDGALADLRTGMREDKVTAFLLSSADVEGAQESKEEKA